MCDVLAGKGDNAVNTGLGGVFAVATAAGSAAASLCAGVAGLSLLLSAFPVVGDEVFFSFLG